MQTAGTSRSVGAATHAAPSVHRQQSTSPALGSLQKFHHFPTSVRENEASIIRFCYVPCRQIGHELDSSSNQGSTHAWWKRCLPSQGNTRTSSPSSKSTMQIGHVSRPMASGIGSVSAETEGVAADGPARGRTGGTSSCSSWVCSTPLDPTTPSVTAVCIGSGSADGAASPRVSCISCPICCPSP